MLYFWSAGVFTIAVVVNIQLCIVVSSFCYIKIYYTLRYRPAQVLQQSEPDQLNNFPAGGHMSRYKKTVSNSDCRCTSRWCYFIFHTLHNYAWWQQPNCACRGDHWNSGLYLSSSLYPIIYFWKIGEVRKAVMATIETFSCWINAGNKVQQRPYVVLFSFPWSAEDNLCYWRWSNYIVICASFRVFFFISSWCSSLV